MISFAVLTLAFSFTVRQYLINDTVESLNRVAETLTTGTIQPGMHGGGHMRGVFFSLANRIAYADYVLLRGDGLIIESSDIEAYPPGIKNINKAFMELAFGDGNKQSLVDRNLVAVHYPVVTAGQRQEKALILYSRLDLLTQVNRSLLGILALALGAGIAVSLIAGALATRVIVEPLQQLKNRAAELAHRQFSGKLVIKTGDEVEELADTFNEMAEQLAEYDRVQKEFFQKASHELKTPLMSVQGYAEAIRDGIIPADEAQNSLDIIVKESGRMKNLVDEFIYLSKMEAIREKYNFEKLSLQDAVREAVHAVQSLALSSGINLEPKFSESDTFIKGDPEKIHRLLLNILSNALRHADNKVTVVVEGSEISVEDDGPGFKPGQKEKIFDPFYRGDNGGSGLGLAISRAIVEKHGGTIRADNRIKGGGIILISFKI